MAAMVRMATAALIAIAAGGSAAAAPLAYDCDTAAGAFSQIKQIQPGPNYRIAGKVIPRQTRNHERWLPSAQVRIERPGRRTAAAIRILPEQRGGKTFAVTAEAMLDGKESETVLGRIRLDETLAFSLIASADGVVVTAGGQSSKLPVVLGRGAEILVICSTGEFDFEILDLEAPPVVSAE